MSNYEIMINTKDFEGNVIRNDFYVSGTEAAYEKYNGLVELFPDAMVDLIDLETGEILKSTEFENEEESDEEYLALLDFTALINAILFGC